MAEAPVRDADGDQILSGAHGSNDTIEKMLKERDRLDRTIREKFTKKLAIVFSDVSGYTSYMSTWGDLRGRAWIQKHHDMVFPIVEAHGGKILDVMGDGLMIAFEDTMGAARAMVAVQRRLAEYNTGVDKADAIHVHVGINSGKLLADEKHITGDIVNVASRIGSKAVADEILISRRVYEEICGCDEILCRYHGHAQVKGKPDPLELYRVVWRDQDVMVHEETATLRVMPAMTRGQSQADLQLIQIEISREQDRLRISAHEQKAGETSTVRHYEEISADMDKIGAHCREIVDTLNKSNRRGQISTEVLVKLRGLGQVLFDDLFPQKVKELLHGTQADHLMLNLDDQVVQIPWELLHDGNRFLCQRFAMGRLVRTRQSVTQTVSRRALAKPLRMMVLADPRKDLAGAQKEGSELLKVLDKQRDLIHAALRSENITPDYIRQTIRNFDIIHYAGHADYDPLKPEESGWRLSETSLKAQDVKAMAGTGAMPALVFANACQSARTEEWAISERYHDQIFGLANAFLLAGVKHYIGTFWEILDEPSRRFAVTFYRHLLAGDTAGKALLEARGDAIHHYGEETIVWASYLLYGDPTFNYLQQVEPAQEQPQAQTDTAPNTADTSADGKETRSPTDVISFDEPPEETRPARSLRGFILVAVVLAVLAGAYFFMKEDPTKYEKMALNAFHQGAFDEALKACAAIEGIDPQIRLAHVIAGDIALRQGDLDRAAAAYQKALAAQSGSAGQLAQAHLGLGRIGSLNKQTDIAMDHYRKAAELAPDSPGAYMAQGFVLERSGKSREALDLMEKARQLAPNDTALAAVVGETRNRLAENEDAARQARIDTLVKELTEAMDNPDRKPRPGDGWTSMPLTLWIMELTSQGVAPHEGEDRLLGAGIAQRLIENGRATLVERAVLDRMMQELKLSTEKLVDPATALALGKILSARLILAGQLTHAGVQAQIGLRVIETETGRIVAAVTETYPATAPASDLVDKVAAALIEKIGAAYPMRAKIAAKEADGYQLNIGSKAGAAKGQRFKAVSGDTVVEVVGADTDTSFAKVVGGEADLAEGVKMERQ